MRVGGLSDVDALGFQVGGKDMHVAAGRLFREERGATAIEYALIIGLVALASIVAWSALGSQLSSTFFALAADSMNAINTGAGGK